MMVNGVGRRSAVLGLLVALALSFGCRGQSPSEPVGTVTVGSLLPLSGDDQSFGITQRRAMDIALAEVNAAGGIEGSPLRIEYADTQLKEDLGVQEYKRLTQQGLVVMQEVTGSGVALRVAPYATQDRVVLVSSLDTSPKLTGVSPYFFRTIASDDYAGTVLSRWALESDHKTAALIYNTENAWSEGLKAAVQGAFTKAGGTWALEPIGVVNSTDDFAAAIVAIKRARSPVQAVVVALMGRQAGLFVSQAKANRLGVPFYGTDTFSQQEFIDNAKGGLEQSFFALPAEAKTPAYERFANEYRKRHGSEPDSIGAKAYDALHVTAIALRETVKTGPLTGQSVRDQLAKVSYAGITGPHAFDHNGDLKEARFERFTYKDGKRVSVQ